MPAKRRLLIVVNGAPFFLSHRLPLALGARDAGFDVHIATPNDDPRIEHTGLPYHPFPLARRGMSPAQEAMTVAALVKLYREVKPDIVHHVSAKPILYGGIASRIARVPAVVHAVTGLGWVFISRDPRARALRHAIRATYRVATSHPNCAVIFQNHDDRAMFGSAIRTKNIVMIRGSGVDLKRFRATPVPEGAPLVVLPSRLLWQKGVGEFVEAARRLKRDGIPARFALVGDNDDNNPATVDAKQLREWVGEGAIEWWGHRSDMPDVFAQSSLVCLPSYREGMPLSLLEATAAGRGIVTTDTPGCRDVDPEKAFSVLVPVRDGAALGEALAKLCQDRAEIERMSANAAKAAPEFAIESVIAKTVEVYEGLLARRG